MKQNIKTKSKHNCEEQTSNMGHEEVKTKEAMDTTDWPQGSSAHSVLCFCLVVVDSRSLIRFLWRDRLKDVCMNSETVTLFPLQQLSQFWYSQDTALRLAQEAIAAAGEGGRIACVSAPSVYQKLRELHREDISVYIFEYDRRFAIYGEEFVFYDYNNPLDLPGRIPEHSFDIVVADPPYLSEECLRKTSETVRFLTRGKVLLCTGAVMEEQATQLLGVKMCKFIPEHSRNLANEFRCYTNYDSGLDYET
ncbi:N(6)-adenine-specific DNA methyltransferase 2 [Cricetulus griseus]|nr:N(6)-adenine-specific DNA methyltransferase 2 [Cricetulus griseus]